MFNVFLDFGAREQLGQMDRSIQLRINKKLNQLKTLQSARHLKHGLNYFVVETGQYRICYAEETNTRTIVFIGTHKQYEKWHKEFR